MAYKYEDWNDRYLRSAFPAVKVHFTKSGEDFSYTQTMMEVTDVRGEIIEIKTGAQDYIHLSIDQLNGCVKAHRVDFIRTAKFCKGE